MAQVTLNKDSWHFKYYSFVVSENPPKTLCPYFWTLVVLLILSPVILAITTFVFVNKTITNFFDKIVPKKQKKEMTFEELEAKYKKIKEKEVAKANFWNKVTHVFVFIFKYIFLPLLAILLIYMLYTSVVKLGWKMILIQAGLAVLLGLTIFGIVYFFDKFGGKMGRFILKILRPLNPLSWNVTKIIGEMIKAAYTKACPLITWTGE